GLHPSRVVLMGSPMKEVLDHYLPQIDASEALERLGLERLKYVLASVHREENVDNPRRLAQVLSSLEAVGRSQSVPVLVSTHPRTRRSIERHGASVSSHLRLH